MQLRALILWLATGPIAAQDVLPVYVDDSPTAEEVLAQPPRLVAQENIAEAASNIQKLPDDEPARPVAHAEDADLYQSVPAMHERWPLRRAARALPPDAGAPASVVG